MFSEFLFINRRDPPRCQRAAVVKLPKDTRRECAAALASRVVHARDARCWSRAWTELCAQRTRPAALALGYTRMGRLLPLPQLAPASPTSVFSSPTIKNATRTDRVNSRQSSRVARYHIPASKSWDTRPKTSPAAVALLAALDAWSWQFWRVNDGQIRQCAQALRISGATRALALALSGSSAMDNPV